MVFIVIPSSIFNVTEAWLQSIPGKHFTVPVKVAFNCKKFKLYTGRDDTSIVCWSGKNLKTFSISGSHLTTESVQIIIDLLQAFGSFFRAHNHAQLISAGTKV